MFLRDLRNGPIYLLSTNAAGNAAANGASFDPYVSRDGKFIVFTSEATDVSGDRRRQRQQDIFLTVAPNNPGDPGDPDPDPAPGPGPGPNGRVPTPTRRRLPIRPRPTASLPGTQPAPTQGSTEYQFNVNLADETALNTARSSAT